MTRYGLRGDQWQRIADLLLGKVGHVGTTARDNRRFVEAVLYRYRAGIPWRPAGTIRRLEKHPPAVQPLGQEGVWQCLFEHLAAEADNEYSTIVRAHQRTAPAHPKKMTTTRLAAARATGRCARQSAELLPDPGTDPRSGRCQCSVTAKWPPICSSLTRPLMPTSGSSGRWRALEKPP